MKSASQEYTVLAKTQNRTRCESWYQAKEQKVHVTIFVSKRNTNKKTAYIIFNLFMIYIRGVCYFEMEYKNWDIPQ
jgi:hypothetical protein